MDNSIISASVLPIPSPLTTLSYIINKTGPVVRFVSCEDKSQVIINKFRDYYSGQIVQNWNVKLDLSNLKPFTRRVLQYVYTIPYGEVKTYGEIACALGQPGAARAVGQALSVNPLPLIIPCHRVVAQNGPGGFSAPGGVKTKLEMLEMERMVINSNQKDETIHDS
ncbi:MAG: methylated-DNA--[protein]-cysteine S-methyltransferase [Syntrophomonadaceae bacterium]